MATPEIDQIRSLLRLALKASRDDFTVTNHKNKQVFAFPARWSATDLYSGEKFCEAKIDLKLFPSLKVLGTGDVALVNKAFLDKFKSLEKQLKKTVKENIEIVFTGYSSGGAIAILATIWFLECHRPDGVVVVPPRCVTFGAPLVGDKFFGHAVRREPLDIRNPDKGSWSSCFTNIVLAGDLAPSILFSPISDVQNHLETVLRYWKDCKEKKKASVDDRLCGDFFTNVLNNAFAITSFESCVLSSSATGKPLVEAVKGFVELSPYRPFGIYFFCCDGKMVKVENHDAVLQILFYSLQLRHTNPASFDSLARKSIDEHVSYKTKAKLCLDNNAVVPLSALSELPDSSSDGATTPGIDALRWALGIASTEAMLSQRAAAEMEKERQRNLQTVEGYKPYIEECLKKLELYRLRYDRDMGYYDSFKENKANPDFQANVDRLELVGYWEDVREMLKEFVLPDSFELQWTWINLGTKIRYLVEPIDIANFYRHRKKDMTGLYETKSPARPKYYKYPENWLAHVQEFIREDDPELGRNHKSLDSCFWARVENMCDKMERNGLASINDEAKEFEEKIDEWITGELDPRELKKPTFAYWWNKLEQSHRDESCILGHMRSVGVE